MRVIGKDIASLYDGDSENLIIFDDVNNSLEIITDVNLSSTSGNTPELLSDRINHDNFASFLSTSREIRVGFGSAKGNTPKWIGKIKRSQLDRNLDGFYVANQELKKPSGALSGYNFDKVIVPYLPPADEMGKRWYQSQLLDMKQGSTIGGGGSGTSAGGTDLHLKPAYQCTLQTSNLGHVEFDKSGGGHAVDSAAKFLGCFDYGIATADPKDSTANSPSTYCQGANNFVTLNI